MSEVIFFEKPGCINNTRQKALLETAGHRVVAYNLLNERWTVTALRPFFGKLPVAEWFNRTAPAVKDGRVVPEALDEAQAMALMLEDPLLIRRPLMQVGRMRMVGFDADAVNAWIGLRELPGREIEQCPRVEATPASDDRNKGIESKSAEEV